MDVSLWPEIEIFTLLRSIFIADSDSAPHFTYILIHQFWRFRYKIAKICTPIVKRWSSTIVRKPITKQPVRGPHCNRLKHFECDLTTLSWVLLHAEHFSLTSRERFI